MPTSPPRGPKLVVPCAWSPGSMLVSGGRGSVPLAPRRGAGCPSLTPASPPLQAEAAVAAVAVADTVRDGPPPVGSDGASKTWGLVSPAAGAPPGGSTGPSAAASFFLRYVLLGAWPGGGLTGPSGSGPGRLRASPGRAVACLLSSRAEGGFWGLLGHCGDRTSGGLSQLGILGQVISDLWALCALVSSFIRWCFLGGVAR